MRFYFGQKDKTLIQRHRQDDPYEWIPETLFSIVNNGSTLLSVIKGFSCDQIEAFPADGCEFR